MKVKIPFKLYFKNVMLNGQKTVTSRTKWYGKIGDTFDVFGATFEIIETYPSLLNDVACLHFREEGCRSTVEFIKIWESIHPRKGFVPSQVVKVHEFERKESDP